MRNRQRALIRRVWMDAADRYWCALTQPTALEYRERVQRELATAALRMHLFEQGRRSAVR